MSMINMPPVLLPKLRSEELMQSAHGMPCSLRLPGICNHNRSTTVMAHLVGVGKSMGSKVSDLHTAFACSACHDAIDRFGWERRGLTATIVLDAMLRGHCETQSRLAGLGIITVKGGRLI